MKMSLIALALVLVAPLSAHAAEGEVCKTDPVPPGKYITESNDTVFHCPKLGKVTIPQVYQKGFRVAHVLGGVVQDKDGAISTISIIIIEKI